MRPPTLSTLNEISSRPASTLAACVLGLLMALVIAGPAAATPIGKLFLSELMFEPSGGDNGSEWIEIYNADSAAVDLSQYVLRWGRNNLANSVALSSVMLAPNSTFVIGGPNSNANNSNPTYNQIYNFGPDLYDGNHGNQEDAVALIFAPTNTVVHIVVYGGNGFVTAFTDEQGATAVAVNVSTLGQGDSLEFQGGTAWQVQGTATPGSVPATVPEPGTGLLVGLGVALLASQRRR